MPGLFLKPKLMCACTLPVVEEGNVPADVAGLPMSAIMKDSFYVLLTWAWCINEQKVKAAFKAKTGLDIEQKNLVTLVKANMLGNDIKKYRVNFKDIVTGIRFTNEEYQKSECKVNLVRK